MKKQVLSFLCSVFAFLAMAQPADSLKLSELEGKWFVIRSNFPMWLKGNKINPSFQYSIITKRKNPVLLDEVRYQKKSKSKSIVGYDKPVNAQNTSFVWRGKGILGGVKSKWSILYLEPTQKWMIIHFKKTAFTPEGYDVISKAKNVDLNTDQDILNKLKELKVDEKLSVIHQD